MASGSGLPVAPKPRVQLPGIQAMFGLAHQSSLESLASPVHPPPYRPVSPAPSTASSQHSLASSDLHAFSLNAHFDRSPSTSSSGHGHPRGSGLVAPMAFGGPAAPPRSSSLRGSKSGEKLLDDQRTPKAPSEAAMSVDERYEYGSSDDNFSNGHGSSSHPYPASRPSSYASSVRSADTYLSRHSHASTAASSLYSVRSSKSREDLPNHRAAFAVSPPPLPVRSSQADLERARYDLNMAPPVDSATPTSRHRPPPPPLPPHHHHPPQPPHPRMLPTTSHAPFQHGAAWSTPPYLYPPQSPPFYAPPQPFVHSPIPPSPPSDVHPTPSSTNEADMPRYACSQCPKRFSRPSSLRIHQYSHSGERPFVCEECGRGFSVASNLRRHSRVHSTNRFTPAAAPVTSPPATSAGTIVEEPSEDEGELDEESMNTS